MQQRSSLKKGSCGQCSVFVPGRHLAVATDSNPVADYFNQLEGEPVSELYQMVLAEMEIPLLEKVLEYTRGNQTKAAELLGLNRGTLRKKLKQYGLL